MQSAELPIAFVACNTAIMDQEVPFAVRRAALLDRIVAQFSTDPRFLAGWLEGSLADGSADSYSDIDLHLCVEDSNWDETWRNRRTIIEEIAPVLAALEIMGAFGVGALLDGPVKLDVFYERRSGLSSRRRIAVKRLWGAEDVYRQRKLGEDLGSNGSLARWNTRFSVSPRRDLASRGCSRAARR